MIKVIENELKREFFSVLVRNVDVIGRKKSSGGSRRQLIVARLVMNSFNSSYGLYMTTTFISAAITLTL